MEILFELFDNPFMLLILLALFSVTNVFKKSSQQNERKSPNKPLDKRRSEPNSPFQEVKEIFKEVTRNVQEEYKTIPTKPLKDHFEEKSIEVNQKINQTEEIYPKQERINNKVNVIKDNNTLEVDETKLIDSVIWAEILGPPRAKKPYAKNRK